MNIEKKTPSTRILKTTAFLFCFFFYSGALMVISSCSGSSEKSAGKEKALNGRQLYSVNCMICHGADGRKGLGGAKDLTSSLMEKKEVLSTITYGKGNMAGFKSVLSKEEIETLAAYLEELKKQ